MSLRDSASYCLQQLVVHLATIQEGIPKRTLHMLIDECVLTQVKLGIKNKNEVHLVMTVTVFYVIRYFVHTLKHMGSVDNLINL